jgi:hypothetical protein
MLFEGLLSSFSLSFRFFAKLCSVRSVSSSVAFLFSLLSEG